MRIKNEVSYDYDAMKAKAEQATDDRNNLFLQVDQLKDQLVQGARIALIRNKATQITSSRQAVTNSSTPVPGHNQQIFDHQR